MEAYLDNSATTRPCSQAVEAMADAMTLVWGNPSSLHRRGLDAQLLLEKARSEIAKRLFCRDEEIYFTSGGTESNSIALFGAAYCAKHRGKRIVSTAIEHPSISETLKQLEADGFEVIRLSADASGRISESELFSAVNASTVLVSVMAVNNETGSVQPVEAAKKAVSAARAPALVHCDAVQAFGKIPFKPQAIGADLVSISSHKIHGPKGVGALYVKNGVRVSGKERGTLLRPRTFGGSQEQGLRPGTQPMPAIAGFAAAAAAIPNPVSELERAAALRAYMFNGLSRIPDIAVNSPFDALPYVTNISVLGVPSEPMLNFLSEREVYVSVGSACSRGKKSAVLSAMGLPDERIRSALRISFSRFTVREEIDMLLDGIEQGRKKIRTR